MKKAILSITRRWLLCGLFAGWVGGATAQISFGPSGVGPLTFETLPPASEWSTRNIPGAAGEITNATQMDLNVQTNTASAITAPLVSAAGNPPAVSASAMWASQGQYLTTRPTGNRCTLLMAFLRNDSGVTQSTLQISYTFRVEVAFGEELPGCSVYYSLTGATGTWQRINALSGTNGILNPRSDVVPIGNWAANAPLYLLWADDNATAAEASLQMDNFQIAPAAPTFARQPQTQSAAPGGSVSFDVGVNGASPLSYQWRKDGANIADATNQTFTITNAQSADEGFYSVVASNAYGVAVSSNAFLTVACVAPVTITSQPAGQNLPSGGTISLSVGVTASAPFTYQWRRNGTPIPNATGATYTKTNALDTDSGAYSCVVQNCAGAATSSNAFVSISLRPYVLMGLTNHLWRYHQAGVDLGTDWRATEYNDAAWPVGRGMFGQEDNATVTPLTNTVLSLWDAGGARIITYYFRTHFTLTNDPALMTLVASNYVDDGIVVYLNGIEAFRINMPPGNVSYNTLTPGVLTEGLFITSNVPPNLLVQGDNVLAVELHQANPTSSDIVFGMELRAAGIGPTLLTITNHPANAVAEETKSATFSVGVSGAPVFYQWFKDGVPLPNATSRTLVLNGVTLESAGEYFVIVSNYFNTATSRVAQLSVTTDIYPPVLVAAEAIDASHILATFSEGVLAGAATNLANYSVTNTLGDSAPIFSIVLTNATNVLLSVGPLAENQNYIVTAAGLPDLSPRANAGLSAAPVARTFRLIAFDSEWSFFDPFPPFDDPDPGPNWKDPGYDTTTWGVGSGAFGYLQDASVAPVPVNSTLGATPVHSSYFRAPFTALLSRAGLRLTMRHAVDDGAVIYLNGQEIHRFNMPDGTPFPNTPAAAAVGNASLGASILLPPEILRVGPNLLAVELHQIMANDIDKFFGLEMTARAESLITGPVLLLGGPQSTTALENQPVTFRVSAVAASEFQWQLQGTNVPGATNAVFTLRPSFTLDGALVRVLCGNGGESLTSTSAVLRVTPDLTPPALVSARVGSNQTIIVSFDEPVEAGSALNLANYFVTNSSGASVILSSATIENETNVVLRYSGVLSGGATVVVRDVVDRSALGNTILPGSAATVGADYFIAMDSPWKYLLINTNETVQSTFMRTNYDDSAWSGPSNALLYVESATLPGPKNTLLSVFDSSGTDRINTYYFRQPLDVPLVASNTTIRLRHIIDDGLVLHLNGSEFYRYNMPAGVVTAATQAPASIGDAVIVGPIDVLAANLVSGPNLFAAEVHQSGTASSDIVFGIALEWHVPSIVLPPPPGETRLSLRSMGDELVLSWNAPGFALERAPGVNGPWTALSASSPAFVPRTNAAAFYRLRQ